MSLLSGGGAPPDLLSDTLMMDDFAPDIDLLDDILGVDYDWKELEPTLSAHQQNNVLQQQQQQNFGFGMGQDFMFSPNMGGGGQVSGNNLQFGGVKSFLETGQGQQSQFLSPGTPPSVTSTGGYSPQHQPLSPYDNTSNGSGSGSIGTGELQEMKPLLLQGQGQPAQQVPMSLGTTISGGGQSIFIPNFSALQQPQPQLVRSSMATPPVSQPQYIQPGPAPTEGGKILTQILPNPGNKLEQGQQQLFSFSTAGFQPVFATTSTANGQTIILPQLQLALVQQDHGMQQGNGGQGQARGNGQLDKLPMKRLASSHSTSSTGSGSDGQGKEPVPTGTSKRTKGNKEQTSRRSSHNAIERRYRSSINDKIIELKSLVCHSNTASADSEKVHKAAILRSSIDTIRYLQNSNGRLEKENKGLKQVLNSIKKCKNCGADQPLAVFGSLSANSNADLRELLTDNSPPPTDHSESSNPGTPNSDDGQSTSLRQKVNASPIALFSIAAGLFLINPGSHHGNGTNFEVDNGNHIHSRVERSVDFVSDPTPPSYFSVWSPRLIAITTNLVLFLIMYYLSGKLFTPRRPSAGKKNKLILSSKYSAQEVTEAREKLSHALKLNGKSQSEKRLSIFSSIIEQFSGEGIPGCGLALKFQNFLLLLKTPFLASIEKSEEDLQIDFILGKCYVEIGQGQGQAGNDKLSIYCGLKSLQYGFNCLEMRHGQNLVLSGVLLTKSKLVLKSLLMKIKGIQTNGGRGCSVHPLLDSGVGLGFLRQNLGFKIDSEGAGTENSPDSDEEDSSVEDKKLQLTTCITPNDPVSRLVNKYKYQMIWTGVTQLFYYGEGAADYFKNAVRGVISERRKKLAVPQQNSSSDTNLNLRNRRTTAGTNHGVAEESFDLETDLHCEWWACILWSQAEWMARGGRAPVLQRLYKVVDSLWSGQMEDPLSRAVYYTHIAKRLLLKDTLPLATVRRLVDSAGESLRDAINLTTDRPRPVIQLLWTLTAEWILEIRLELWEELNSSTDVEFTRQFSRDLDTLRSLTHYVPSSLPSVYLYEASLRLMTKASPGRTQQLLDASLRSVRLPQRPGLICHNNGSNGNRKSSNFEEACLLTDKANSEEINCRKKGFDRNLIREKRKAFALYLRCKHLPSAVMTCPGEKAGMLREALKCLEVIGDGKKIAECLEMIKSLHSVALY